MSLFDLMMQPPQDDSAKGEQRFIDRALSTYYKWKIADRMAETGLGMLSGEHGRENLDDVDKRLSIRMKKKALGLPMDSDDYELATNEGLSYGQKGVAAFAKHMVNRIPEPAFLKGSLGHGLMETSSPFKTTATGAGDYLLSSGLRASGGHNAAGVSGLVRKFFR